MRIGTGMMVCGLMLGAAGSSLAVDLGSYNGCAATDNDFTTTKIFQGPIPSTGGDNSADAAVKVAFDAQPNNLVDVYFIQKNGAVSRYNGAAKTVDALGSVRADKNQESGLTGIALDPNFKTNRYIYLNYAFIETGAAYSYRISRFTLDPGATGKLNMASEKILLKIVRQQNAWHTAGALYFDAYGDLWCNIGDNQQTEVTAGNTGDLRGGILRIHPDTSARGYSIPKGNFGEYFSTYFKDKGNADLAAQYADTNKVKPQIYVKGTRNAYSIGMDPVRRWLAWGDVGPDQNKISEEYNLVTTPVYAGWPYYAGAQNMGAGSASGGPTDGPYGLPVPVTSDPNAVLNNLAGIKGVKNLPPVKDPIHQKQRSCAMSGPIFRYDGANPSPTQFPPQFDHKWLIGDCNGGYGYRLMTLNAAGTALTGTDALKIFDGANVPKPKVIVDMQQGPDGALYIVDWFAGSISRIDYTGTCKDPAFPTEKPGCADPVATNYNAAVPKAFNDPRLCSYSTSTAPNVAFSHNPVLVNGLSVSVSLAGGYALRIVDMSGRVTYAMTGEGERTYQLPAFQRSGIFHLEVVSSVGVFSRRLAGISP